MAFIKRSELRGILILTLVILLLGGLLAVSTGKLETWFGITIGGGPKLFDQIVFVSARTGANELYVMGTDGSEPRQLTEGGIVLGQPFAAASGNRVVFVGRANNSSQVFMVRGIGGEPTPLTSVTGGKRLPQYSPDSRQLAFLAGGTVYVGDQNGDNLEPILPTLEERHEATIRRDSMPAYSEFAWSPTGAGMAAVTEDPELGNVVVHLPDLRGKSERVAIPIPARVIIGAISWARTGSVLAVLATTAKESVVVVLDFEQENARIVAGAPAGEITSIALDPNGENVSAAFVSKEDSNESGIRTIEVSTGRARPLAQGSFDSLSYSPKADKLLAVEGVPDYPGDIVVIDTDTGRTQKLTTDGASFDPVWTPTRAK